MDEYIKREEAMNIAFKSPFFSDSLMEEIKAIPPADVSPVRHAKWDENGRCSNCGGHAPFWCMASTYYKSPWCQECGAKMDLEG